MSWGKTVGAYRVLIPSGSNQDWLLNQSLEFTLASKTTWPKCHQLKAALSRKLQLKRFLTTKSLRFQNKGEISSFIRRNYIRKGKSILLLTRPSKMIFTRAQKTNSILMGAGIWTKLWTIKSKITTYIFSNASRVVLTRRPEAKLCRLIYTIELPPTLLSKAFRQVKITWVVLCSKKANNRITFKITHLLL